MTVERTIHIAMFILLLVGLWSVSAWISYTYLNNPILQVAGITLSWGVILVVLYLSFKKLDWDWWG
ncbi:MAG TPA: hypothetical protein VIH48_04490 [Candidatus Bathyarchaeia archaeon]